MRWQVIPLLLAGIGVAAGALGRPDLGGPLFCLAAVPLAVAAAPLVVEKVVGFAFDMPTFEEADYFVERKKGNVKVAAAYRIFECRYNIRDMMPREFALQSKSFLQSLAVDPDAEYSLIQVKDESGMRYFVRVAVEGPRDFALQKLREHIVLLGAELERFGFVKRIAKGEELKLPVRLAKVDAKRNLSAAALALGLVCARGLPAFASLDYWFGAGLAAATLLLALAGAYAKRGAGYALRDAALVVKENAAKFSNPDYAEIHGRATQYFHMARNVPRFVIVVKLRQATADDEAKMITARAESLEKWGDALNKASWLAEAERLRGVLRRRDRSAEAMYVCRVALFAPTREDAAILASLMASQRLNAGYPVLEREAAEVLY